MATPFRTTHLDSTPSTMGEARHRFDGGPVLVTAGRQTEGRGRSGSTWVHADRAVAASLALRSGWDPSHRPLIPLVAGLAAAGVFEVSLKWPNDLVLGDLKLGGLLVEADDGLVVVGLGVNLYWPEPIDGAGALFDEDPGPDAAERLAGLWAADLLDRLEAPPTAWGREAYESLCTTIGSDITWDPDGRGRAVGIDEAGHLVVDTATGSVTLDSGAVQHVRDA